VELSHWTPFQFQQVVQQIKKEYENNNYNDDDEEEDHSIQHSLLEWMMEHGWKATQRGHPGLLWGLLLQNNGPPSLEQTTSLSYRTLWQQRYEAQYASWPRVTQEWIRQLWYLQQEGAASWGLMEKRRLEWLYSSSEEETISFAESLAMLVDGDWLEPHSTGITILYRWSNPLVTFLPSILANDEHDLQQLRPKVGWTLLSSLESSQQRQPYLLPLVSMCNTAAAPPNRRSGNALAAWNVQAAQKCIRLDAWECAAEYTLQGLKLYTTNTKRKNATEKKENDPTMMDDDDVNEDEVQESLELLVGKILDHFLTSEEHSSSLEQELRHSLTSLRQYRRRRRRQACCSSFFWCVPK